MAEKGSSSSRTSKPRPSSKGRGGKSAVKTPPSGTPRAKPTLYDEDSDSLARKAMRGREVEFWGIGCIALGLLLALSIYVGVAGPVGRGIETSSGWLLGLGRFALPLVALGIGIAMVRHRSIEHRARLTFGWMLIVIALLGLLHVINGADKIVADVDAMSQAGGWLGALLAEPLRSTISWPGALVVLFAIAVGGVLLVTDTTVPELIALIKLKIAPASEAAISGARTLVSERGGRDLDHLVEVPGEHVPGEPMATSPLRPSAPIFDAGDDPDLAASKKPRAPRKEPAKDAEVPAQPQFHQSAAPSNKKATPAPLPLGPAVRNSDWSLPPTDVLSRTEVHEVNKARVAERGRLLEESLSSHGVDTRLVGMTVGPTVTRFELELGSGVKVSKVTSLDRDIAYAMAATDVRILAPIPGKSAIGVEVPNESRQLVSLGDLITSPEARAAVNPLDVAIGKDIAGRAVFLNLATTPHLLIAGATGAGKSSGLNSIITSLLMRTTPDQVRLILIDPKQVEMGQYARLPHLLTAPVTNPKKAANALSWAVKEMERRYDLLVEVGFRDIAGYNAAYDRGEMEPQGEDDKTYERLPYIVVVVDELNDLMMVAARDVEECITRIAQKARAVGIHLIVATQRPSVNVITGVIKANIPARMAFAVSSLTDSRVILDRPGAEKLVGQGDMLLLPGNSNVAQRIQGSWVGEDEVRKVVSHWRRQSPEVVYVSGIEGEESGGGLGSFGGGAGDDDDLLMQAIEIVVRGGVGSTSLLQRKLKVGFARAGRLMDLLEERGIVGPSEGSKARTVLMSVEELDALQGGA